ncbi:Solitary outer membrane autotransporter beta-barrel domain [Vibrio hippocampi]|uniref:Solitary outer membrane autotransporter-like beta-barrel domain-containing protein n=1 Tax=Vibrio hippocampi TaxID=654686 RepID=A0ABN8DRH1_9VIBR|nr:Solitary outer membrane autotransporter beta-barrel domain [Vibrio hippocampi]CAH0529617.1 hypothetical protein VHP8226_03372 [Vibrio hippocampi]
MIARRFCYQRFCYRRFCYQRIYFRRFGYLSPLCIGLLLISSPIKADPRFSKLFENAFAGAVILSDSDAVTLGFKDFDPNNWLNIDDEDAGTPESVDLRKSLNVYTLPWTETLTQSPTFNNQLVFRLSALEADGDTIDFQSSKPDKHHEYVLGGYVGYQQQIKFEDHWSFNTGVGAHLQYYKSRYSYNSAASKQYLKPLVDGVLVNTDAWATTAQSEVGFSYLKLKQWGKLTFDSSFNYFYGVGWGEANQGDVGYPEGWYWSNEAKLFFDVTDFGRSVQTIYSSIRRVDIGGDTFNTIGSPYYYEATLGWLMTPPFAIKFVDNIGIGLSINYGSALKGGSLVLFFNQD